MSGTAFINAVSELAEEILASASLTTSYADTESDVVDLIAHNKVAIAIKVDVAQTGKTALVRFLWSVDDVNYFPETSETASNATVSEQPYVPYPRREDVAMDAADNLYTGGCILGFRRQGRYFKVQVKAATGTTTGKISIIAQKLTD